MRSVGADVPLSNRGREQAATLAKWSADLPAQERPTLAVSSPYRRALDTAREVRPGLGPVPLRVGERLRDATFDSTEMLYELAYVMRGLES